MQLILVQIVFIYIPGISFLRLTKLTFKDNLVYAICAYGVCSSPERAVCDSEKQDLSGVLTPLKNLCFAQKNVLKSGFRIDFPNPRLYRI